METLADNHKAHSNKLIIRTFIHDDIADIVSILKQNSLYDGFDTINDFHVLTENETIVGAVQIVPYPAYYFLSYMATRLGLHNKGLGSYLINNLLITVDKPVYLYTIIPEFYKRFGFNIIKNQDTLPEKDDAVCKFCIPEKCRTMKWTP